MKIIEEIGEAAMLEQLAEECTELAKAALKMARIIRKENPTPVTEKEAIANIREEYTDVVQCAGELLLCFLLAYDKAECLEFMEKLYHHMGWSAEKLHENPAFAEVIKEKEA